MKEYFLSNWEQPYICDNQSFVGGASDIFL